MNWPRFIMSRGDADPKTGGECEEAQLLLSLHSDGMTSAAEGRRVDEHLAVCENCRNAYFWMRATHDVLSQRPVVLPPIDMSSRIMRAIADADVREPAVVHARFNPRPAFAAAASVLIAAVTALSLIHGHKGAGTSTWVASAPVSGSAIVPPVIAPSVKPPTRSAQTASRSSHLALNSSLLALHSPVVPVQRIRSTEPRHIMMARVPGASLTRRRESRPMETIQASVRMARVEQVTHQSHQMILSPAPAHVAKLVPAPSVVASSPTVANANIPSEPSGSAHAPMSQSPSPSSNVPVNNSEPVVAHQAVPQHGVETQIASVPHSSALVDLQHEIGDKWRWSDIHGSGAKATRSDAPHGDIAPIVGSAID